MDRKNINRGFKKLRVWQDAVSLYILAYKVFAMMRLSFPAIIYSRSCFQPSIFLTGLIPLTAGDYFNLVNQNSYPVLKNVCLLQI